ncbi:MAG: hypothetical protein R3B91_18900 [Planctomycetaceae bacterium]
MNDDLSLFDDTARSLGRSAMRSVSDFVYKTLLANAGAFFDAANGNYDEGGDRTVGHVPGSRHRSDDGCSVMTRTAISTSAPERCWFRRKLQQTAKELLQSDFIQRSSNDLPTGNAHEELGVAGGGTSALQQRAFQRDEH